MYRSKLYNRKPEHAVNVFAKAFANVSAEPASRACLSCREHRSQRRLALRKTSQTPVRNALRNILNNERIVY